MYHLSYDIFLNENYQLHHDDTIINVQDVLLYQPHISKSSLLFELFAYSSDDDSIDDFETISNKE